MFHNSGKKIQTFAIVVFILSLLIALLGAGAVIVGLSQQNYGEMSGGIIVAGIIAFVVFAFFAWLSALMTYSYGKIVESQETFLDALRKGTFTQGGQAQRPIAQQAAQTVQQTPPPMQQARPVQGTVCPSCGNPVEPGTMYCKKCGAKLQ